MGRSIAIACLLWCGCERSTPRFEGPMRVAFGDCSTTKVAWVSGPRPMAFTDAQAETRSASPIARSDDPPRPGDSKPVNDGQAFGAILGTEVGEMKGGGFGAPRGQIGTRAPSAKGGPVLSLGTVSAQGDLDKAIIRRYVKRNSNKLQYCYERELLSKDWLGGTVNGEFFIDPDGVVKNATASGVDKTVASCVAGVLAGIQFPKPKSSGVHVRYPFTFRSAAGATVPPPTAQTPVGPPEPEPPQVPMPVAAEPVETVYEPGAKSPLRPASTALAECVRKGSGHGAFVVELDYGGDGAVTRSTVHGAIPDEVRSCIALAVKAVKGETRASQRCGVAFGTQPLVELPAVTITATAISVDGTSVGPPEPVSEVARLKLPALYDRVHREPDLKDPPVLALRPPTVVKPLPTTPMAVLNPVMATLVMADVDFVLAAQTAPGEWRLVHTLALPVIPTPLGTGERWHTYQRSAALEPSERVVLSVLAQKERTWVGLSRVNEFQEVPHDAWDKLEATLVEHKRSAFFSDRLDLEIAGDDVTYADVIRIVEIAAKAGFTHWTVMTPFELAAPPRL
ncbi:MAG: AgmX/PglI C-terminal domain-containing protein [Kofleriaceae bacterium]